MQASVFEISIFPLVLQIPVSRRIHTGKSGSGRRGSREEGEGVRARIRAEYRKRFVGGGCDRRWGRGRVQEAEEVTEKRKRRVRRNVRASRHQRTLRLHPIPRFYSLIPLCSPPGSQGDFYSSLRISTLTSRHPQPSLPRPPAPSPTSRSFSPFRPAFLLFLFLSLFASTAFPVVLLFFFSRSLARSLELPSGTSPGRRSNTLPRHLFTRHPFRPLRHTLRDSHEST